MLYVMAAFTLVGMGYVGWLWYQSRQAEFIRYPEFRIPIPAGYEIHGIDISHHQGRIAWTAVKAMQVQDIQLSFAFMKATEGITRTDPFFKRNWQRSKEAGLIRGAYHFYLVNRDAAKQANNFVRTVNLERGDLPPVLDVEQTGGRSSATIRKGVGEWLRLVEAHYGIKPIIYTNADFYTQHLKGHFDDYPLWVAHYLQPHQPRIKRDWQFWQHSEKGRVNGIYTHVDFNVFNGSKEQFAALLVP